MNQRNLHVPHRPTPNPRQQHAALGASAAADYVREQVAQIYGEHTPAHRAQQKVATPQTYARTYRDTGAPHTYDWQRYHSAWQDYYQQYYQRYYLQQIHQQRQQTPEEATVTKEVPPAIIGGKNPEEPEAPQEIKSELLHKIETQAKKVKKSPHFKPLVAALAVGFLFLFLQFNRTIEAQVRYYISPGTVTNDGSSLIVNTNATAAVSSDPKIIIPKINVDVPVVYNVTSYADSAIQNGLKSGVVHYGTTTTPGQVGNNVIVGHSSNDLFDSGQYKFAFVLLDHLNNGDVIELNYQGKQYIYKVFNKAVVAPTDFSLVNVSTSKPIVSLITCTPPGTALKRLIVQAEQISPDPAGASQAPQQTTTTATLPSTIPGNSPTMFQRILKTLHL